MVVWKRTVATLLIGVSLSALAASAPSAQDRPVIGIAMPGYSQVRWVPDGANLVKSLAERGYLSDLQNADSDAAAQISQIENMVTRGDKVLVIAPVSASSLTDVLSRAAAKGIKVIAYDRMIRGTPNVDYYVTFDNFRVGVMQAQSLLRGLDIERASGPFNIELIAGSPDDFNSYLFYRGAMSILRPLIENGRLVVQSGQISIDDIATPRWNANAARARFQNLLDAYYVKRHLDAVLSPEDDISLGIIALLKVAGYGTATNKMPVISGQDCEIASLKAIIAGEQYSSIIKDTRQIADIAAQMAVAILTGSPVPVNEPEGFANGIKQVPTYLLDPVLVYKENIDEALIRNGYYQRSQIYSVK